MCPERYRKTAGATDRGSGLGAALEHRESAATRPRHDARLLTGTGREAEILLDGTRYVLRITRQHKLILTK